MDEHDQLNFRIAKIHYRRDDEMDLQELLDQPPDEICSVIQDALDDRGRLIIAIKNLVKKIKGDTQNGDDAHAKMWHREAMRLAKKHNEKTFYN